MHGDSLTMLNGAGRRVPNHIPCVSARPSPSLFESRPGEPPSPLVLFSRGYGSRRSRNMPNTCGRMSRLNVSTFCCNFGRHNFHIDPRNDQLSHCRSKGHSQSSNNSGGSWTSSFQFSRSANSMLVLPPSSLDASALLLQRIAPC